MFPLNFPLSLEAEADFSVAPRLAVVADGAELCVWVGDGLSEGALSTTAADSFSNTNKLGWNKLTISARWINKKKT